eukprot:m.38499 g.38499  ORF g.38499 m.38499 type:complete len:134 (+) comp11491_c0_seq1:477-878(+)
MIDDLLKRKVDINAKDNQGNTSLHIAVHKKDSKAVKKLLQSNPDLGLSNNEGQTPLDIALEKSEYKLANLLVAKGADIQGYSKKLAAEIISEQFDKNISCWLLSHWSVTSCLTSTSRRSRMLVRVLIKGYFTP